MKRQGLLISRAKVIKTALPYARVRVDVDEHRYLRENKRLSLVCCEKEAKLLKRERA